MSDGAYFLTQAEGSGNAGEFVDAIIAAAGGVVDYTPNSLDTPAKSGRHVPSAEDFHHAGAIDGRLTWFGAQAWINYLNVTNYQGYSDWRLPTTKIDLIGVQNGHTQLTHDKL